MIVNQTEYQRQRRGHWRRRGGAPEVTAMVSQEHLKILKHGVQGWNAWRSENVGVRPNLTSSNLTEADLHEADLHAADLHGAHLSRADLTGANLTEADLTGADLTEANLRWANLSKAELHGTDLTGTDLTGADLSRAILVETSLQKATLNSCRIYGISASDVTLDAGTKQHEMIITPPQEPSITVDDLEVAQFVHPLLCNTKIRRVIDSVTSKVVLILGRFTPRQKAVLDALRGELQRR
ncbi:MAG TPA: pentapeptide repeat-containing protein, partial [Candidatus Methylomirabilis sp.]|nr:pentapeptide repeat-containing protein [Candidatus Methylomirabilis sp.]